MLIDRRDLDFQLNEVLGLADLTDLPRFQGQESAEYAAMLDSAFALAEQHFLPYAALGDREEPAFDDGRVLMPEVAARSLDILRDAGFFAVSFDEADGGLQLPRLLGQACSAIFASANVGYHAYAMLTAGAANLVLSFGSEQQKQLFGRRMASGEFFGTMCLSEPQAGSSLSDLRCEAVPRPDGSYRLRGSKMWISGGEHDLAGNIVHLVLARTPGAPPGIKGISLFIVPRIRVLQDGSLGERNDVRCIGVNHKMGWRGTVNTVLAFGEQDECEAWRIGEEGRGLAYMFKMMNEARIGVGVCAVALGYAGYRHALAYATERRQGRPLSQRDPATPPVPILQHPDVRRMLLTQKAYVEGGLSLVLYCARLVDERANCMTEEGRESLTHLLEFLTPIAKSWPSEFCLEANKLAIQVLGGYGYTRDYPVERLYRDNRLNHIHEGTWGIQAQDLLGRKIALDGGVTLRRVASLIRESISGCAGHALLEPLAAQLETTLLDVSETAKVLVRTMGAGALEKGMLNATPFLDAVGHLVVGWRWLEQARAAVKGLAEGKASERAFYQGKLSAARHFHASELAPLSGRLAAIRSLDVAALEIPDAGF
ncbi:MAG: acyl-CoA dehydrogenase [Steroidobacteraceae bacterium]